MGKWLACVVAYPLWVGFGCSVVLVGSNYLQQRPLAEGVVFFGLLAVVLGALCGLGIALTAFRRPQPAPAPAKNGA